MSSHASLAAELRQTLRGEADFGEGIRAAYAYDASNYRQIPIGVVIPKTIEDVIQTVSLCRKYGAPILSRGAATSLAGQCCNEAVILDFSKYLNKILEINPVKKTARVQPGVILDDLNREAAKYGLTFGPDPATHSRCTIGGMIGNNSCGVHSVISGKTVENTRSLEILTYEGVRLRVGATSEEEFEKNIQKNDAAGEIYKKLKTLRNQYSGLIREKFPQLPRRVSGYNLNELLPENQFHLARALVGTEGTCAVILEAELQLVEMPAFRSLVVAGYPSIEEAADDVPRVLSFKPVGLEGIDRVFVGNMKKAGLHLREISDLPAGEGWLLAEFGGRTQEEADQNAKKFSDEKESGVLAAKWFREPAQQKRIWSLRESSFGASVFVPGEKDTFSGFEDSAVPPEKLGSYLRELNQLYSRYGYRAITYGHFGDGCIHTRISFDLKTETGIQTYKRFLEDAADLVVKFGGSFSGEHGDGQTWGHLLHKMYGHELVQAFREFKAVWDPQNKMNPGKGIDTYGVDQHLRQREYSKIKAGHLHFDFTQDGNDFSRTTERCIGIGKCVAPQGGTMCPSYRATHDEKHSTRGRAHLLHEMMRGEVVRDGWKSEAVKEALDECLACKACKSECPVKVDMASYKAEFMSHYYEGKRRPLSAYLFGFIARGARIASKFPRFFNFFVQCPGLSGLFKKITGIAQERRLPILAVLTFRDWFCLRKEANGVKGAEHQRPFELPEEVILWPDTFSNYFHPEIAKAAVEVLEYAGFRVKLPPENLCCGRPLYDQGLLGLAKEYLEQIMAALKEDLERGALIVGLEPSCISVFRDELLNFFPGNPLAERLSRQSFLFAEFLDKKTPQINWPKLSRKAVMQKHCHEQAVMNSECSRKILDRLELDYRILETGCCGMAGSFGFEAKHYGLSLEIAKSGLLPELKKINSETLVLTDGFSCREQIQQLSGKRPLHLAEVVKMSLDQQAGK